MTNKIFVYRNLHKKCYSLLQNGRVFAHSEWVMIIGLEPCTAGFRVSKAGRQRVLAEKRKNVHAFAWGYPGEVYYGLDNDIKGVFEAAQPRGHLIQVSYNPYKAGYFYRNDTGTLVSFARQIFLTPTGVWVLSPTAQRNEIK